MFIIEIIIAGIMGLFGFTKLLNSKERVDKEIERGLFNKKPKRVGWIALIGSVAGFLTFRKPRKLTMVEKLQLMSKEGRLPFQKRKKKTFWQKITGR